MQRWQLLHQFVYPDGVEVLNIGTPKIIGFTRQNYYSRKMQMEWHTG